MYVSQGLAPISTQFRGNGDLQWAAELTPHSIHACISITYFPLILPACPNFSRAPIHITPWWWDRMASLSPPICCRSYFLARIRRLRKCPPLIFPGFRETSLPPSLPPPSVLPSLPPSFAPSAAFKNFKNTRSLLRDSLRSRQEIGGWIPLLPSPFLNSPSHCHRKWLFMCLLFILL